jgi:hypothetical protein
VYPTWTSISALLLVAASGVGFSRSAGQVLESSNSPFPLVTTADLKQWQKLARSHRIPRQLAEPGAITCSSRGSKPDSVAPVITVVRPDVATAIHSPVDVELRFSTAAGAHIDPNTLLVCYVGLITVDITDRLRGHSTVTEAGLEARGASLPSGNHRLRIILGDSVHRVGVKEVSFHVS